MRAVKEIREQVLSDPAPFREVYGPRETSEDPAPLQVKEVRIEDRRYVICLNEEEAKKDRADREAIVTSLQEQLRGGNKSLVGNKGYRKYLKAEEPRFQIDREKVEAEARFDGIWVLQTDLDLDAATVALKYKELWQVEDLFRSVKSILDTRPIYHHRDDTIRGHVFCSFLALILLKELQARMRRCGYRYEWARLREELDELVEMRLHVPGGEVVVRSIPRGSASQALRAAGVALGPAVRFVE
jgi:IS4 transposase